MNDRDKLMRCVYWMGFLTGGLNAALEQCDWNKVEQLRKECIKQFEDIFYSGYEIKVEE